MIRKQSLEGVGVESRHPASAASDDRRQRHAQPQELLQCLRVAHHVPLHKLHTPLGKKLFHDTTSASVVMREEEDSVIGVLTQVSGSPVAIFQSAPAAEQVHS